jgi:hypothetical protein
MGNLSLALQAAEQAAKEMGDAFTNRQKLDHTSSDGSMSQKPTVIEFVSPQTHEGTD